MKLAKLDKVLLWQGREAGKERKEREGGREVILAASLSVVVTHQCQILMLL